MSLQYNQNVSICDSLTTHFVSIHLLISVENSLIYVFTVIYRCIYLLYIFRVTDPFVKLKIVRSISENRTFYTE